MLSPLNRNTVLFGFHISASSTFEESKKARSMPLSAVFIGIVPDTRELHLDPDKILAKRPD